MARANELWINGTDASNYGLALDNKGLSALLAPPPLKAAVENKSAIMDGKKVIRTGRRVDERTFTLTLNMLPVSPATTIYSQLTQFMQLLSVGKVDIKTKYQSGVEYHCDYISCQAFEEYGGKMAHISLRLNEPNPANRTVTSSNS